MSQLELISATPSPYVRKVRIALTEKGVPFKLNTEVPWDSTTQSPRYSPLEKLPILLVPKSTDASSNDNVTPVYESHFILEWLETKYPQPALFPTDPDQRLAAKEIEVISDSICDALVLRFWGSAREDEKQSPEWRARQERKIHGGMRWLHEKVQASSADGKNKFLVEERFGLADIAAGTLLGLLEVRGIDFPWKTEYSVLNAYCEGLSCRESFGSTMPYPQTFKDKIV